MTMWLVELEAMSALTIQVETDGESPTREEIDDAAAYVNNHVDTWLGDSEVMGIEKC